MTEPTNESHARTEPPSEPPSLSADLRSSTSSVGTVLGVFAIGLLILGGLIWLLVVLLIDVFDDDGTTSSTSLPNGSTSQQTDDPQPTATPDESDVVEGAQETFEIELDSEFSDWTSIQTPWISTLEITETVPVVFDVRSDVELELSVHGDDVSELNDGRGTFAVHREGTGIDPLIMTVLEPGEYLVVLEPKAVDGAEFYFTAVTAEQVSDDDWVPVDVSDLSIWWAITEAPEDGTVITVDTIGLDGDPVLWMTDSSGKEAAIDDSGDGLGSDRDPYLEFEAAEGLVFIAVTEYFGTDLAADLHVAIE